jgi:hypothetical protein
MNSIDVATNCPTAGDPDGQATGRASARPRTMLHPVLVATQTQASIRTGLIARTNRMSRRTKRNHILPSTLREWTSLS